ncbi:hypothetical protein Sta7437_1012 [Stanieria cyanosphaera PCC 7437]|uniref:Tic20 family protein n=1 Tax=Stanieria cyanosphaera (strain ATCC 29371 / PCC 7437) TaxID=111780 RepID=K9XSG3_STAC7|nr:Tic20 family protein [Stanieria cyanosphaera]AFZ34592.1 hypothetical protein Sta7437_1012 [Stanieria cyanosphaera PCC 7437]
MVWRGSTDFKDRIFAALVYLLPLYYALPFGSSLFAQFPLLEFITIPLIPIGIIYNSIPFAGLIIFFVLFLAVVRNERISHFIRFNTMQAILLDIILFLFGFLIQILGQPLGAGFLIQTLSNVLFLGTLAACVYAIIQSFLGKYAEIPTLSDAVYSQVR